jgi:hypothetical protein
MSYAKGLMDGWYGDEPEIDAEEAAVRERMYDNAYDDWKGREPYSPEDDDRRQREAIMQKKDEEYEADMARLRRLRFLEEEHARSVMQLHLDNMYRTLYRRKNNAT